MPGRAKASVFVADHVGFVERLGEFLRLEATAFEDEHVGTEGRERAGEHEAGRSGAHDTHHGVELLAVTKLPSVPCSHAVVSCGVGTACYARR